MVSNRSDQETDLVDAAVARLNGSLPSGWTAERSQLTMAGLRGREPSLVDPVINLEGGGNARATLVVEARRSVSPRDVERLLAGLARTFRSFANVDVLIVAPWLSRRTQELLRNEGLNYIDLTGNISIAIQHPAVFIRTSGAIRNPDPQVRDASRLRGPKAGRLVRTLIDVRPPYGVRELAEATELTRGYVSRLLDALDRDALVDRGRKGEVVAVDYPALLRRWVESYDLLKSNDPRRFIAPEGAAKALEQLGGSAVSGQAAVTGSFAAVRWAPVAAPALLLVYADEVSRIVDELNLLPADEGANVVLLRPFDRVVWDRAVAEDGLTYVAPSQAAADCLTGTGRMPAEGEALITWMTENEDRWRSPSLRKAPGRRAP